MCRRCCAILLEPRLVEVGHLTSRKYFLQQYKVSQRQRKAMPEDTGPTATETTVDLMMPVQALEEFNQKCIIIKFKYILPASLRMARCRTSSRR
jgi:hypothetical protein